MLQRCEGTCTCGGACTTPAVDEESPLSRTLRAAVAARAISTPVLQRLRYPGQTCEDDRLDELHGAMKAICDSGFSCAKGGLSCDDLKARKATADACLTARKGIENECFGGNSDAGHKAQIQTVSNAVSTCASKIASKGCR